MSSTSESIAIDVHKTGLRFTSVDTDGDDELAIPATSKASIYFHLFVVRRLCDTVFCLCPYLSVTCIKVSMLFDSARSIRGISVAKNSHAV